MASLSRFNKSKYCLNIQCLPWLSWHIKCWTAWTFLVNLLTQVWQICNASKKKLNGVDVWFLCSFDFQIMSTFPLIMVLQRFSSNSLRLCPVLIWPTGGGHGWRFIPSLILILTEFRSGLSQWACTPWARLTFHPRASINQRLATVAPLLPPSTSWGCVLMAMMAITVMAMMAGMVAWLAQWTRRRVVMRARSREQALTALAPRALMRYLLCDQPLRLSNVLLLSQQSFGHWIAKIQHWSWCPEIRVCCLIWVRLDNFLLHLLLSNDGGWSDWWVWYSEH